MMLIDFKPKNRFRVCGWITVGTFIWLLIGCTVYIWMMIAVKKGTATWNGGAAPLWAEVVFIFMFIILPFIFSVYFFLRFWPIVIIDEKGLHRSLLGIFFKKTILWEDIKDIKNVGTPLGSFATWTFFSKSSLEGIGITRGRLRRDNIFLMCSKELDAAVKYYFGKNIADFAASKNPKPEQKPRMQSIHISELMDMEFAEPDEKTEEKEEV